MLQYMSEPLPKETLAVSGANRVVQLKVIFSVGQVTLN